MSGSQSRLGDYFTRFFSSRMPDRARFAALFRELIRSGLLIKQEHPRILRIERQDGKQYKMILEKGVDFLTVQPGGKCTVKAHTYVMLMRET